MELLKMSDLNNCNEKHMVTLKLNEQHKGFKFLSALEKTQI